MRKLLAFFIIFNPYTIYSQNGDGKENQAFLDSIYKEMDAVLGAMFTPKSFATISLGAGTGFYNFKTASTTQPGAQKKLLISPSASYLHKSGFGINANAYIINENDRLNVYQYAISPSFDYIRRGRFTTGLAFTRYLTKKDLSFYTTPIQNEAYGYFTFKKPWLQPGVALAHGWGNRTQLEERKLELLRLRKKRNPTLVTIRSDERISDLSALFSVRHNFTWSKIIGQHDLLSIMPVVLVSTGTRSFGFNTSFQANGKVSSNFLPDNQYVNDKSQFSLQSMAFILRGDYSTGIFFFQPQFLLDYSLQAADRKLNNAFAVVSGINF